MPENENRPAGNGAISTTTRCVPQYSHQLRQRRSASYRLPALNCGCRDPWPCRHPDDQVTDREVNGYRDAAQHLLAHGLTPVPNLPAMRAMWKRGGDQQRLAMQIAGRWETAA